MTKKIDLCRDIHDENGDKLKYILVSCGQDEEELFEKRVNRLIEEGYIPQGSAFWVQDTEKEENRKLKDGTIIGTVNVGGWFYQSMVFNGPEESERNNHVWSVTPKKSEPKKCPVCGGRGIVPNGFYLTQQTGTSTDNQPGICKSCGGSGVLWG